MSYSFQVAVGILHMVSERGWNARAYWAQNAPACFVLTNYWIHLCDPWKLTSLHCSSNRGTLSRTQYIRLLSCAGKVDVFTGFSEGSILCDFSRYDSWSPSKCAWLIKRPVYNMAYDLCCRLFECTRNDNLIYI